MKKLIFTILGALLFCGLFSQEIPHKISYQGKLLENGSAVTDTKNFTFTIGAWSETHSNVQVTDGLYSVTLGETTPIPVSIFDNSSSVSLQISVEGTTLSPQTDVLSVPYAYKAEKTVDAEKLNGQNPTFYNNWNNLNNIPSDIADGDDGLTLPYSGTYNGSSCAFQITNDGGGCIYAQSNSDEAAVWGQVNGSGTAIAARVNNGEGTAIYGNIDYYGTGKAGYFQVDNPNNTEDAIYSKHVGGGNGGYFFIDNPDYSDNAAVYAISQGAGHALYAKSGSYSTGSAGGFKIEDISNNSTALYANTTGTGKAGSFIIDNSNSTASALYVATWGTGYAGFFMGDVYVSGNINKSSSSVKTDHPLDPENKYLQHSTVSSSDMMNVYNGNIILDDNGEAIIKLPEWFESLNKEFRYQLTCIGGYAPVYIAKKISGNSFKIAGGIQRMEVSWQVTGVRQDPYANQHRIQVEVEKSERERGHYLHYKEYNQPVEKSIRGIKDPEIINDLNINEEE